jgi:glycosyltransferase involved in cell wall biosynthesis
MKIVAVNADKGIAPDGSKGAAIHLRSILRAFVSCGHEVILHSRRAIAGDAELGFEVRHGTDSEVIEATIVSMGADFVYERYSLNNESGLQAARRTKRILALEVNAPLLAEASLHRPETITAESEETEKKLWRDADVLFPVSTNLGELIADVRETNAPMRVLANGVHASLYPLGLASLTEGPPWTIAFLGHPKPWHGTALLAKAFAALAASRIDARLLVIGGGNGAEILREEFASLDISDRLLITGALSHENATLRLRQAHLSLAPYSDLPSFYFSPLKIMESLAAGVPLITNDVGDIRTITAGFAEFARPGDADDLVKKIEDLIVDPAQRRTMALAGQEHVLSNHTWDMNARVIIDDVKNLIEGRSRE